MAITLVLSPTRHLVQALDASDIKRPNGHLPLHLTDTVKKEITTLVLSLNRQQGGRKQRHELVIDIRSLQEWNIRC